LYTHKVTRERRKMVRIRSSNTGVSHVVEVGVVVQLLAGLLLSLLCDKGGVVQSFSVIPFHRPTSSFTTSSWSSAASASFQSSSSILFSTTTTTETETDIEIEIESEKDIDRSIPTTKITIEKDVVDDVVDVDDVSSESSQELEPSSP